jgi:hypothetical protein
VSTPAEKERQILTLAAAGVGRATIARTVGTSKDIVCRVIEGGSAERLEQTPIDDVPTVQGLPDRQEPPDEDLTTKSIYEAAEVIRERRPRDPVGYQWAGMFLRAGIDLRGLPRGGRERL